MRRFGMTPKEWYAFGIGSSFSGALVGAMLHSLFIVVVNVVCLGLNLCLFGAAKENESGQSN